MESPMVSVPPRVRVRDRAQPHDVAILCDASRRGCSCRPRSSRRLLAIDPVAKILPGQCLERIGGLCISDTLVRQLIRRRRVAPCEHEAQSLFDDRPQRPTDPLRMSLRALEERVLDLDRRPHKPVLPISLNTGNLGDLAESGSGDQGLHPTSMCASASGRVASAGKRERNPRPDAVAGFAGGERQPRDQDERARQRVSRPTPVQPPPRPRRRGRGRACGRWRGRTCGRWRPDA